MVMFKYLCKSSKHLQFVGTKDKSPKSNKQSLKQKKIFGILSIKLLGVDFASHVRKEMILGQSQKLLIITVPNLKINLVEYVDFKCDVKSHFDEFKSSLCTF